jgi:hypothetical protein
MKSGWRSLNTLAGMRSWLTCRRSETPLPVRVARRRWKRWSALPLPKTSLGLSGMNARPATTSPACLRRPIRPALSHREVPQHVSIRRSHLSNFLLELVSVIRAVQRPVRVASPGRRRSAIPAAGAFAIRRENASWSSWASPTRLARAPIDTYALVGSRQVSYGNQTS